MSIQKLPIALEMYSVREEFAKAPEETLVRIREMGYDGVEFYGSEENNLPAGECERALRNAGLKCMGYQPNWPFVGRDTLLRTFEYSAAIGNRRIGIASAPVDMLRQRDTLEAVIRHLNWVNDEAVKAGFEIGYHTRKTDFVVVDGQTAWNRIFENTPDSFKMVLDTGNALAGGAWSIPILEKFPHRSPWVHIKPFSLRDQGATMIDEDDFDWNRLLKACVELGGADTLTVEYSNNRKYAPMDAVRMCVEHLRAHMRETV